MREDSTVFVTFENKDISVLFKDGTIIRKDSKNKIEILNPNQVVVKIRLPRDRDFNVIGSGSAFAYLGFKNIL